MKTGVLGSGEVGKVLAGGFLSLGHETKIGSREPEKLADWVKSAGKRASAGTFEDAARFGEPRRAASAAPARRASRCGRRTTAARPGVVKAFNTVGNPQMIKPAFPAGPPDMFICGNDDAAKKTVAGICDRFGWGVIDIGGIEGSRHLEAMGMVWVLYGVQSKTWNHAFKMLKK